MRKLLIALAILATSTGCAAAEEPQEAGSPGKAAPGFTITTFEGDAFSLTEQRGTPVVLNFWESW